MKIVILGGGGFIGSTIADRLLAEGHSLRIFERPRVQPYREFTDNEAVEWIVGDLSSMHDVSHTIHGVDAVLHMVSTTLPKNSNQDPIFDVQSNIVGSLHVLNAMVANNVGNIVFIVSVVVLSFSSANNDLELLNVAVLVATDAAVPTSILVTTIVVDTGIALSLIRGTFVAFVLDCNVFSITKDGSNTKYNCLDEHSLFTPSSK